MLPNQENCACYCAPAHTQWRPTRGPGHVSYPYTLIASTWWALSRETSQSAHHRLLSRDVTFVAVGSRKWELIPCVSWHAPAAVFHAAGFQDSHLIVKIYTVLPILFFYFIVYYGFRYYCVCKQLHTLITALYNEIVINNFYFLLYNCHSHSNFLLIY